MTISEELLVKGAVTEVVHEEPGLRVIPAGPSVVDGGVVDGRGIVDAGRPPRYRDLFALREYRGLFTAELLSLVGDQVAAVAIAVLLFERSGSPFLAAVGYATTYLPWALGGPVLSVLADRLPARRVMVGCDAVRAALIGLAALPGLPLLAVALLVFLAAFLAPPADAAISATLPLVADGEPYGLAISLRSTVIQSSLLVGFAAGGLLVAVVTPSGALLLDAVTFALSAVIISVLVRPRPAAMPEGASAGLLADAIAGLHIVSADRRRYGPLLLGMAGAAYVVVPEGIATAYAHLLGYGAAGVGALMAAVAAGNVVGAVAVGRFLTDARRRALMCRWPSPARSP